mmetsp:Transcript_4983/g.11288  ORF Transcript_4983/g.11288 Transcript_4983/m.11288 type:complete len:207 (+) Transcript_4983:162-782(+)
MPRSWRSSGVRATAASSRDRGRRQPRSHSAASPQVPWSLWSRRTATASSTGSSSGRAPDWVGSLPSPTARSCWSRQPSKPGKARLLSSKTSRPPERRSRLTRTGRIWLCATTAVYPLATTFMPASVAKKTVCMANAWRSSCSLILGRTTRSACRRMRQRSRPAVWNSTSVGRWSAFRATSARSESCSASCPKMPWFAWSSTRTRSR